MKLELSVKFMLVACVLGFSSGCLSIYDMLTGYHLCIFVCVGVLVSVALMAIAFLAYCISMSGCK